MPKADQVRTRRQPRAPGAPGASGGPGGANAAVGYARRSTDRQEQSIPDQQKAVERYCAEHGLRILRWYIDDAISGTRATNRPAFQKMLADAQKPGRDFASVVVYDVKRFGRLDNDEAGYYRHILRQNSVDVLYVAEGFSAPGSESAFSDTDDLLRPVKQWQARQESKDLSKVTIRGLLSKSEGGWWMGGAPPLGYDLRYESERGEFLFTVRFMPDGTKEIYNAKGKRTRTLARGEALSISKRDRARLFPGAPDRVVAVRTIFRLYTEERRGLSAISEWLNNHNVPTPRGPGWSSIYLGVWRDSAVRAILMNPVYTGDMVWNRRTDARFHRIAQGRAVERKNPHGARLVLNDEADWITVRDAHGPLVSRRVWAQAREIRSKRAETAAWDDDTAPTDQPAEPRPALGGWTGARARFLLSGLVHCGRCGGKYQGVTRTKGKPRNDGTKVKTRHYGCGSYIAKGLTACTFGSIGQQKLEQQVIEEVLAFYRERYGGPDGMKNLAAAVRDRLGHEAADLAAARKRLKSDRAQLDAVIAALLDNMTPTTRDLAEERLTELRRQRALLEARAAELERLSLGEAEVRDTVHDLGRFLAGLEHTLRHGFNEEKKAALRRCVERVVVLKPGESAKIDVRSLPQVR